MDDNLTDLKEFIEILENYKLPDYREISNIPLYMEQVIGYIQGVLGPLEKDKTVITPFMVNNYVKAKIVSSPENKKYNKDHIAYLLAISLLKSSASMRDLATLIEMDKYLTDDKQKLYNYFKNMHDEVLKNQVHRVKVRIETLEKDKKRKRNKNEENLSLTYIALRLYVESETSKLIADEIMSKISKDVLPESVLTPSKKVDKYEGKKESKEAKTLSTRK